MLADLTVGEVVYMLNPYFRDGTRLRLGPDKDAKFSDMSILNDAEVVVLGLTEDGFAHVRAVDEPMFGMTPEGWVRSRNLTRVRRLAGIKNEEGAASASPSRAHPGGLKRGSTVSNLERVEDSDLEKVHHDAGVDKLMSFNSVKAGSMGEMQRSVTRTRAKSSSASIRKQLRNHHRFAVDPHSKLVTRWDGVTATCLLFTATITPFEVCVLEATPLSQMSTDPLSWTNRVVDVAFCFDILLNCFLGYQEPPDKGGAWVMDVRKIVVRYVRSWMPLDVLTAIPVDVIIAAYEANYDGMIDANSVAVLRIVRMLRLLKLARILRASRILRRWQSRFGISYAWTTLMKFTVLIIITSHWLACFWVLVGRLSPAPDDEAGDGSMTNRFDASSGWGHNWIEKAGLGGSSPAEIYGVAIHVAFSSITGGSSGNISPATAIEFYLHTAMMVVGSFVWAYVISNACGILATLDPNTVHYHHMMDTLNSFARDKCLPREMTVQRARLTPHRGANEEQPVRVCGALF